jgi:hypothetical protein
MEHIAPVSCDWMIYKLISTLLEDNLASRIAAAIKIEEATTIKIKVDTLDVAAKIGDILETIVVTAEIVGAMEIVREVGIIRIKGIPGLGLGLLIEITDGGNCNGVYISFAIKGARRLCKLFG